MPFLNPDQLATLEQDGMLTLTPDQIGDDRRAGAMPNNPPTPPLEELRIILEGAQALRDMEADAEHPDPTGDALDLIDDALATLAALESELSAIRNPKSEIQ